MTDPEVPGIAETRGIPEAGDEPEEPWQRLDPRMLLVHPVNELLRFLPVLIGVFLAGQSSDNDWWQFVGVSVPIALGLLRYLTTSFRIHSGRIELRHGLLNRHVVSTALGRVRTVDLTSSPIHRLLGLTKIRIGTGTSTTVKEEQPLVLDGLATGRAQALRHELLHSIAAPTPEQAAVSGERVVTRFTRDWLRFAPFTSTGLVIAAGATGLGSQIANELGAWDRIDWDSISASASLAAIPLVVVSVLLVVAVLSVIGYLVANYGFTLSHTLPDGSWHLRRGLFTVRETSLDDDRVRGVEIGEPLGLRLARGRRLAAIVTGLGKEAGNSSNLLPPAPTQIAMRVAAEVLGTAGPVHVPLRTHGPAAVRRRWVRALVPAVVVTVPLCILAHWWSITMAVLVLAAAVGLAVDRVRSLGHALVEGCYVARHGSLTRSRAILHQESIIGWNLRSTWFQRRVGLVTLTATMAGGGQSIRLPDVPLDEAVAVASAALPHVVPQFQTR